MAGRQLCARRLRPLRSRWKPRSSRAEAWAPAPGPCEACVGAGGCCRRHRLVRATRSKSHRSSCMAWGGGAGQGSRGAPAVGGDGWGPAVPGAGSGLHCRGTAPASLTCNATAMHRGAARLSRPPRLPPATGAASKEGSARPLTPPQWGQRGAATLPWTQALAKKPGELGPPAGTGGLTPQSSAAQGGTSRDGKGVTAPLRPARPPAPPLTLSMELPAGVVARLSCR